MDGTTYHTSATVTVWATAALDIGGNPPSAVFDGNEIDMKGTVRITPTEHEVEVTLWNIGSPLEAFQIFRRGFLMAVDLAQTSGIDTSIPVPQRVVIAAITSMTPIETDSDTDIGYRIKAVPIDVKIAETAIKSNFLPGASPWQLKTVVATMLQDAGVNTVSIDIPDDLTIPYFTADGTVLSEINRAAGKANGQALSVWMRGGTLHVGTSFLLNRGIIITEDYVFDVQIDEQILLQPVVSVPLPADLTTGDTVDASANIAGLDTSQTGGDLPPGGAYKVIIPLSPQILQGDVILMKGGLALGRMGINNVSSQDFNVLAVEHQFTTELNTEELDTTTLTLAKRSGNL